MRMSKPRLRGDGHDRALGDAFQRACRQRWSDDDVVANREDVLAGALGDQPVWCQHDRFVVAGLQCLDLGKRRVDIVARCLRSRGHGVVVVASPRRDLHANTMVQGIFTEERGPRPTGNGDIDAARQGVESHLAVAVVSDRSHVATGQTCRCHRRLRRGDDLGDGVRDLHPHDVGAAVQPLDVLGQAEHRRALRRRIRADALEHAGAVVQRVSKDVNLGLVPIDEVSVHPDLRSGLDWHRWLPLCRGREK